MGPLNASAGGISRTASDGRDRRVPIGVMTNGRLISIGSFTDKRDVLQIVLETVALDDLADQLVESTTRGRDAIRTEDLVIDGEPLPFAGPVENGASGDTNSVSRNVAFHDLPMVSRRSRAPVCRGRISPDGEIAGYRPTQNLRDG
jgi:hypothetical protein